MTGPEASEFRGLLLDIAKQYSQGHIASTRELKENMILSGYNPGALATVLKQAQQEFHEGGRIPFQSRPFLNYSRLEFLEGGQVRKGETIANQN